MLGVVINIESFQNHAGVAVGCGWQAFVAYVNVGCYYGVGIPLGCVLGFKFNLGAKVCMCAWLITPMCVCTRSCR